MKPSLTKLHFNISLTENDIDEAEQVLNTSGKYVKAHSVDIYSKNGDKCATLVNEVYMRDLNFIENIQ